VIHRVYSKREKAWRWAINITVDGRRVRQGGFATKDEATAAIAALRLRQRAHKLGLDVDEPEITLQQLLTARQADKQASSTRNRTRLLGYFADFVAMTDPMLPVRSVGLSHLRAYRDTLSKQKPGTIRFKMAGVVGSLNAAPLYFPALENYRAPRLVGPKVTQRAVLVPRGEFLTLLTTLRTSPLPRYARAADVLELLMLTGARVGEILALKPAQVDQERGLLSIYASKTKSTRLVPIAPRAALLLADWSTPNFDYHAFLKIVARGARLSGFKLQSDHWRIHDIRHTAASLLAEAGVSHSIIAALLGHTLPGVTAHYTHATLPALRKAVEVLETLVTGSIATPLRLVN